MDPHLCSAPTQRSGSCGWGRDIFWFLQNRRARKTGIWSWVIKWAWWSRKLINLQECFMHLLAISTSFICVIEIDSYGLKYPHWWYWWVTCNFSGCTSVAGGWKLNRSSWAFALFCSWSKDKKSVGKHCQEESNKSVFFAFLCSVPEIPAECSENSGVEMHPEERGVTECHLAASSTASFIHSKNMLSFI